MRIGLAGQFAAVDPNLTGRENLTLMGRLAQVEPSFIPPRVDELLRSFDLEDAGDRPARTYSGGMRRRLDVAASLVQKPPVLFLDEPTTGLDLQSRQELWNTIRTLVQEGTTVILTTQYLEEADQLADDLVVDRPRPDHRAGHGGRTEAPPRRDRDRAHDGGGRRCRQSGLSRRRRGRAANPSGEACCSGCRRPTGRTC